MDKILIINGSNDLYGANKILSNTISCLIDDADMTLFIPAEGLLTKVLRAKYPGLHIEILPQMPIIQRNMRAVSGILDAFKKAVSFSWYILSRFSYFKKFDLVLINTLSCAPLIPIFKFFRLKVCVHVHEILSNEDRVTNLINTTAIRYSDAIIAVSGQVNCNLTALCTSSSQKLKIHTLWNGIDDLIDPSIKNQGVKIVFTLFGRIKLEKGQWYLLEALSFINPDLFSRFIVRVIGSPTPSGVGAYKNWILDMNEFMARTGLEVEVIEFVEDISYYLNSSDVILVPSLIREAFPTVILEGLSAGKIVIATGIGGSVESIENGKNGVLVDIDNPAQFAGAIEDIILNMSSYNLMRSEARRSYLDNFTTAHFEINIRKLIHQFLQK